LAEVACSSESPNPNSEDHASDATIFNPFANTATTHTSSHNVPNAISCNNKDAILTQSQMFKDTDHDLLIKTQ